MLGILTYPPRWFWNGTRRELSEARTRRVPRVCFRRTLKGIDFIAFEDGYVAMQSDNWSFVARCMNGVFLGLTLLTGTPADPVTDPALEDLEVNSDDSRTLKRWPLVLSSNFANSYESIRKEIETPISVFGTDELDVVVRFADKLVKKNRPSTSLRYLDARNQFRLGNWTASLVLGWSTIEEMIDGELVRHLIHGGQTRGQARNAVRRMTERDVIRDLRVRVPLHIGKADPTVLSRNQLRQFDWLRLLRNAVVHEGRAASKADADRMKRSAEKAMWRLMRHQNVEYKRFLDEILPLQKARESRLHGR